MVRHDRSSEKESWYRRSPTSLPSALETDSGKPAAFPENRPPFREIGHPSGNPVSSGRFPAGLGGRFAPESVAGFLWNHRPVSSGIRKHTRFPCAVEDVLARLVLFDWVVAPQNDDLPYLGFNVPFVVRVDDNALRSPRSAPDCSTLVTTPQIDLSTGDEYESPIFFFNLNESHVVAFEECIERTDECLRHLLTDDTHWPFLKVAIGNLIKAFFADGLEQLLWHVTVLETLLGERKQGVATSLAGRIAALLGTTQNKKKELRKQFGKLYDFRCSLVHGSEFKEDIQRKQLFEARMMARRVMIWFVHYFGDIAARVNEGSWQSEVPKREDFLILLDLSDSDRVRLSALLSNLPTGFPTAPAWSR